jgi:hypothetical protein
MYGTEVLIDMKCFKNVEGLGPAQLGMLEPFLDEDFG